MKSSPLLLAAGVLAFAGCTTTAVDVRRRPVTAVAHFTIPHFEVSQVDVPPEPTNMVPPRLRIRNPGEGPDGYAVVDFIVDADGIPREVQWVEASDELFASLATASVAESRFRPAQKDGRAVATRMEQRCGVRSVKAYSVLPSDRPPGPPTVWIGDVTGPMNNSSGNDPFDRGTYYHQ